jgi:hypothetical protein
MLVERATLLPCTPERCHDEVLTIRMLQYVTHPMLHFDPVDPAVFPERWEDGEHLVSMRLFGLIPFGRQVIGISRRDRSQEMGRYYAELRDNGRGTFISKWDHLITIEAQGEGCRYSDRVEVQAGLLTPFIWLFAWFFYRHRQRRWRALVEAGFDYAAAGWPDGRG